VETHITAPFKLLFVHHQSAIYMMVPCQISNMSMMPTAGHESYSLHTHPLKRYEGELQSPHKVKDIYMQTAVTTTEWNNGIIIIIIINEFHRDASLTKTSGPLKQLTCRYGS